MITVALRLRYGKKNIAKSLITVLLKMTMFVYIPCIYKKTLFSAYLKLVHSFHHAYFNNFNMPFKSVPHWIT